VGQERWWLRPASFVGVALLGLVGAVATLVRNWRLIALEALPAVWLGAISWQWRRVVIFGDDRPVVDGGAAVAVAVLVLAATFASYWCNVTFALTVRHQGRASIGDAFAEARRRASWVWAAALTTAALHVSVVVGLVRVDGAWFPLALGGIAVLQMYAFVAVPVVIATGRVTRQRWADRVRSATASLGVSGITAAPGVALNRLGVLLLGLGWLRWPGMALVGVGAVLQVAGVSSATAVKFASRLGAAADVGAVAPASQPSGKPTCNPAVVHSTTPPATSAGDAEGARRRR
jgi:hypothetical protein